MTHRMDYLNIDRQLLEQLADITASVERINNSEMAHPLDKDLLLNQIRDLYSTALKICTQEANNSYTAEDTEDESLKPYTHEEVQAILKAKENLEKQEDEKDSETENIDYESYMDIHEPFGEPQPETEPICEENQELPQNEEPETTVEPEPSPGLIPPMYGPIPEDFEELRPQNSDDEEIPEPEPAPEPQPERANTDDIIDKVLSRKNAIENLVSQQQSISAEPHDDVEPESPQPAKSSHPQPAEGHPQLSLLDYLPGVSRVVENVEQHTAPAQPRNTQPQQPTPAPQPEIRTQPQPTAPQPAPEPTPAPAPKPAPAPQPPAPATTPTPTLPELRSLIGINDKFTFINDLFEKDMRNYNEFISTLNKIYDIDQARTFVQQNATMHRWDKESMAVQLFMSVFKRRYQSPLILQ